MQPWLYLAIFVFLYRPEYSIAHEARQTNDNSQQVISTSKKALEQPDLSAEERFALHKKLASSEFYVGNYSAVSRHAEAMLQLGTQLNDTSMFVTGAYYRSAYYRALEAFKDAEAAIELGEKKLPDVSDDLVKASFYYNAAACYTDNPSGDHKKGREYFQAILDTLPETHQLYHRACIRLASSWVRDQEAVKAEAVLAKLNTTTIKPRTKVHYLLTLARILSIKGQFGQAILSIDEALPLSQSLGLTGDTDRLMACRAEYESILKDQTRID